MYNIKNIASILQFKFVCAKFIGSRFRKKDTISLTNNKYIYICVPIHEPWIIPISKCRLLRRMDRTVAYCVLLVRTFRIHNNILQVMSTDSHSPDKAALQS